MLLERIYSGEYFKNEGDCNNEPNASPEHGGEEGEGEGEEIELETFERAEGEEVERGEEVEGGEGVEEGEEADKDEKDEKD